MSINNTPLEVCLIDAGIMNLNNLKLSVNLVYLNVHCNRVKQIEGLQHLNSLKHLDLSSNELTVISGLSQCKCLRTLNLASNHIKKITGLDNLRTLKSLNLSFNQITDISGLKNFTKGSYKLEHVELYGNKITSVNHITRILISSTSIKTLYFIKDNSTNPVCNLPSYRPNVLTQLPWLQNLDGYNKLGGKVQSDDVIDIPGLDEYIQLLQPSSTNLSSTEFCNSSIQSISSENDVITPKIDAVLEKFKQHNQENSDVFEDTTASPQVANKENHAPVNLGNTQVNGRLESLENKLSTLVDLYMKQQETNQDEEKNNQLSESSTDTDQTYETAVSSKSKGQQKTFQKKILAKQSISKITKVKSNSHSSGLSVTGIKKNVINDLPRKNIRTTQDDETYLSLMQELDAERERRWKAEQASRKLLDSIKMMQERSLEDRKIQEAHITNSARLKQALDVELNTRRKNEESIKILQVENVSYREKLDKLEKCDLEQKQLVRELQEINMKIEKEQFEQNMHHKKRFKEMQFDSGGTQRELEMLQSSAEKQKSHIQQLQELLISREQEHKTKLQGMVHIESNQVRELLEKEITKSDARNKEVLKQMHQRLNERNNDYAALEDEFRMALQIEANRYNELHSMFEETSNQLQELKISYEEISLNEAKSKSLITELSALVKEQKIKITEIVKNKTEIQMQYKERLVKADDELVTLRKVSAKVESLTQDKERMAAHIKGQESVIHGLRSERKLWGQELAQQGASLAQERGRLDVQLDSQTLEIDALNKQLKDCNDTLKIKCKLINDQTETIKKMKQDLSQIANENKKLCEDEKQENTYLNEELVQIKQENISLQDEVDVLKDRKDKLKDDLAASHEELEQSIKEHKKLRVQWDERSKLIDVLEHKVLNMKTTYENKEKLSRKEKDEALSNLKTVTEQLRACEERHRLEVSTKQHDYELEIRKTIASKDDEIQEANEQMRRVEDEMREILSQSASQKKNLEKRVKQLTQALQNIHIDLT